jgi:outer membrane receptor protein involved in Fe transport
MYAISTVATPASARAVDLDRVVAFSIEQQSIESALIAFSKQAHIQVIISPRVDRTAEAPALNATVSARVGLDTLLRNMGLTYAASGESVNVTRAGDASASQSRTAAASPVRSERDTRAAQSSGPGQETLKPQHTSVPPAQTQTTSRKRDNTIGLEEVVVTAQKREERITNVPISISVLSGKELDRSRGGGLFDELSAVPGVAVSPTSQGGGTLVTVRGVAASGALFSASTPIGYYLDSVPFGFVRTAIVPDTDIYDLDHVEVLRGPQGTLYGASSLGGVVRVLTKEANLSEFDFKARALVSSTEDGAANYRGDMAVNLPIVPGALAARVVVGAQDLSGWINSPHFRDINDAKLSNIRLKVNAQPTDNLLLGFALWHSQSNYGAPSVSDDNGVRTHTDGPEPIDDGFNTYNLKISYELSAFTISDSASYLKYHNISDYAVNAEASYVVFDSNLKTKNFSDELLLNSNGGGPWRWSMGAFYRHDTDDTVQSAFLVNFFDTSSSYAVFGQLTRVLWEHFEATGGLRYFHDRVETGDNPATFNASPLFEKSTTYHKVSPQGSVTWHPNIQSSIYASYSEGFRSGTLQDSLVYKVAPTFTDVKPDTLKNYEIGFKGALADGKLLVDAAAYYMDWRDVQQVTGIAYSGFFVFAPVNVGKAAGPGVDLSVRAEPTQGLEIAASYSWNNLTARTSVMSGGALLYSSGDRLNNSPKYTAGGSVAYRHPIWGGFLVRIAAAANYTSPQFFRFPNGDSADISHGDGMLLARSSLSIEAPDHWSLTGFVDNLTDNRKRAVSNFDVPDLYGRVRPRTFGLEIAYKY